MILVCQYADSGGYDELTVGAQGDILSSVFRLRGASVLGNIVITYGRHDH